MATYEYITIKIKLNSVWRDSELDNVIRTIDEMITDHPRTLDFEVIETSGDDEEVPVP